MLPSHNHITSSTVAQNQPILYIKVSPVEKRIDVLRSAKIKTCLEKKRNFKERFIKLLRIGLLEGMPVTTDNVGSAGRVGYG